MKLLHTADIHLREYGDERWKVLQKLIEIGKKEKITCFIISGDLFDSGIDAETLRPQMRDAFSNNGFKIFIIPGNHDKDSYRSDLYFGDDTVILNDPSPFEYDNVRIVGLPFEDIEGEEILNRLHSLKNKLTPDKKNILLYHGELLDAFFSRKDFGDEEEKRYMPVRLSYFDDLHIDYLLGGHFHSNFDVRRLKNGGYFVYPGSPVSITKREIGKRKVNIFEVGKPPKEYPLDTPHFEEITVTLDPFKATDPQKLVKMHFEKLHPQAKAILTVKGYINGKEISETELQNQIKKISKGRCVEEDYSYLVRDIQIVLEDELFKGFMRKLEEYDKEKKESMRAIAIEALMRTSYENR